MLNQQKLVDGILEKKNPDMSHKNRQIKITLQPIFDIKNNKTYLYYSPTTPFHPINNNHNDQNKTQKRSPHKHF